MRATVTLSHTDRDAFGHYSKVRTNCSSCLENWVLKGFVYMGRWWKGIGINVINFVFNYLKSVDNVWMLTVSIV